MDAVVDTHTDTIQEWTAHTNEFSLLQDKRKLTVVLIFQAQQG